MTTPGPAANSQPPYRSQVYLDYDSYGTLFEVSLSFDYASSDIYTITITRHPTSGAAAFAASDQTDGSYFVQFHNVPNGDYTVDVANPAGQVVVSYASINVEFYDELVVTQTGPADPVGSDGKATRTFEVTSPLVGDVLPALKYSVSGPGSTAPAASSFQDVTQSPGTQFISVHLPAGSYRLWVKSEESLQGPRPQYGQLFYTDFLVHDPIANPTCLAWAATAYTPVGPPDRQTGSSITIHTVGGAGSPLIAKLYLDPTGPPLQIHSFLVSQAGTTFTGLGTGIYTIAIEDSISYQGITCTQPGPIMVEVPLPELEIGDQLTFLPWVQPKLLRAARAGQHARPQLALKAKLVTDNGAPEELALTTDAAIYGSGDVLGVNPAAILATTPSLDATGFSPLQLASIEFRDEDFPWRFSSRKALLNGADTPLPWLMLLVLQEDEFTALPLTGRPLPAIQLPAGFTYPDVSASQQQLWAHVQVNYSFPVIDPTTPQQPTPTQIDSFLNTTLPANPDLAYSRVFCPRRLAPNTAYQAFLLPATEAGRLAGQGKTFGAANTVSSSIPTAATPHDGIFPVYFQWKFSTGTEDDFESLVQQLHVANDQTSGAVPPQLTLTAAGTAYHLAAPGLLVDAAAPVPAGPPMNLSRYLFNQLAPGFSLTGTSTGRPVVSPPLYGRAYMARPLLLEAGIQRVNTWKYTLNLDPRYRALAALGAEVIQNNQEEYVRRAWEQVQDLLLANEKLRGAQYGLRTTAGLRAQHLPLIEAAGNRTAADTTQRGLGGQDTVNPDLELADYGLHLSALALPRTLAGWDASQTANSVNPTRLTLREAIRRSSTPLAVFSPAFRRILKPFGRYQISQAGRPLRPTQAAPKWETNDLRQPGTSLQQRDTLLSQVAAGHLTAAPPPPDYVRIYQFEDHRVDALMAHMDGFEGLHLSAPGVSDEDLLSRFNEAFATFKLSGVADPLAFSQELPVLPDLPLAQVKQDVLTGTQPGPLVQARIKQAVTGIPVPAPIGTLNNDELPAEDGADVLEIPVAEREAGEQPDAEPVAVARGAAVSESLVDSQVPAIKQAKITPVFKDPMAEPLRRLHPELFVPGLGEFPAGGVAVLEVNQRFIEAYMVGLNHALGSELFWRGFPVELRGTFFQQFWDVSELLNSQLSPAASPTSAQEAALLDILPIDQWVGQPLGANAPEPLQPGLTPLRLAIRSELLRRYPTLVIGLQPSLPATATSEVGPDPDPTHLVYPRQRLAVGQDIAIVTFDVSRATASAAPGTAGGYYLLVMERPGQPQFGLDENFSVQQLTLAEQSPGLAPEDVDPLNWNDFSWPYLGTAVGENVVIAASPKPHATAEPASLQYLTDSAAVAYALFQEPVLAAISVQQLLAG